VRSLAVASKRREKMKAIVLTFDMQSGFAELAYKKYMELWPKCPLQFRIAFNEAQQNKSYDYFASKRNVELIQTPSDIRSTMEKLLCDVGDDEWVYWCVDDRYPIEIKSTNVLNDIYVGIMEGKVDSFNAIKLFTWRETLTTTSHRLADRNFVLQKPSGLYGFWHHYYVKSKVLKFFFFSEELKPGYRIADFTRVFHSAGQLEPLKKTLVPMEDILLFGEPCVEGMLTINGIKDLRENDCPLPPYRVLNVKKGFLHRNIPAERFRR